jgi:thymidylate synthase (FAD)
MSHSESQKNMKASEDVMKEDAARFQVRVVALTQPVGEAGISTPEELIAYCARVSNPSNQYNHETAPRLLKYLARHGHWSPFEMAAMCVEIITTRDVSRQILRHRSFSFQEFSQRYAVSRPAPQRTARTQHPTSRQMSQPVNDPSLHAWWSQTQQEVSDLAFRRYHEALERGLAREVARALLPEGLTTSVLYMHGTIRSWIHYCQLRCRPETQPEHRAIALACRNLLIQHFPSLTDLLATSDEQKDQLPAENTR